MFSKLKTTLKMKTSPEMKTPKNEDDPEQENDPKNKDNLKLKKTSKRMVLRRCPSYIGADASAPQLKWDRPKTYKF